MQYKVPQNVDIEDKVIASLTLRQFTFLMCAGGLILGLKFTLTGSLGFLFMPLAFIIAIFGLALAFYKINDRPFEVFLISAAKTLLTPNQRIWQREGETINEAKEEVKKKEVYRPKKNVEEIRSNLEKLAMIVDSGTNVPKDRSTNIVQKEQSEPAKITDVLAKTEKPSEKLDEYISEAQLEVSKKDEKPISTLATVNPKSFEYDSLKLENEAEMVEMLKAANEKQREAEEKLDQAKIKKH